MQRQRGGSVPVGEAFTGLGGPLKELRPPPEGSLRAYRSQNRLVLT